MLGDTIETVEKDYMPFVRELRDRVSRILKMAPDWKNLQRL